MRAAAAARAVAGPVGAKLFVGERKPLVVGFVLVITLVGFESLAVVTALPATVEDIGGIRFYGWAFSAFFLAGLIGTVFAGQSCDRHGPLGVFIGGLALFAVGLVVCGVAPSMPVVVAGRIVQGLGAGVIPAVVYVAIGRSFPQVVRARMFAVLSSAWVVPGLAGPSLAGVVSEHLSWRLVFLGLLPLVPLAALLTVPGLARLGPPEIPSARRSQMRDAVVLAVGAGAVIGGLSARNVLLAIPLAAAGVSLAVAPARRLFPGLFSFSGRRAADRLSQEGRLAVAVSTRAFLTLPFFAVDGFIPLMLTEVEGRSNVAAGVVLTFSTLTWTAGAWVQVRLTTHNVDRGVIASAGQAGVAIGIGIVALVVLPAVPFWVTAIGWAVSGFGIGLAYAQASLAVLADVKDDEVGRASAALTLTEQLAIAVGTGVAGAVVALGDSVRWSFDRRLAIIFVGMLAVATLGIARSRRL